MRPGLPAPFTLEAVDVHEASDDVLRAMFAVAHAIEREDLAEPPWVPEAEWIADLRSGAGLEDRADWLVRDATGAPAARAAFYARRTLTGSPITLADQAEAAYLLSSSRLAKTTGQILSVDGGLHEAFLR